MSEQTILLDVHVVTYAPWEEGADEREVVSRDDYQESFTLADMRLKLRGADLRVESRLKLRGADMHIDGYITWHKSNDGTRGYYELGHEEETSFHFADIESKRKHWDKLLLLINNK